MNHRRLQSICAETIGIDIDSCDRALVLLFIDTSVALSSAKPKWDKPGEIESEIEGIRKDIRALVRRIEGLHHYARWKARHALTAATRERLDRDLSQAARSDDTAKLQQALDAYEAFDAIPPTEWPDFALLDQLLKFEVALRSPGEIAVALAPIGRGRARNEWAYRVALIAARFFQEVTGNKPTFWTGGETAFSRFVSALYRDLGIRADLRKPVEWAMSKLDEKT